MFVKEESLYFLVSVPVSTYPSADAFINLIAQTPYVLPYVSCATIFTYINMIIQETSTRIYLLNIIIPVAKFTLYVSRPGRSCRDSYHPWLLVRAGRPRGVVGRGPLAAAGSSRRETRRRLAASRVPGRGLAAAPGSRCDVLRTITSVSLWTVMNRVRSKT